MKVVAVSIFLTALVAVQAGKLSFSPVEKLKDFYLRNDQTPRIISGQLAADHQFPWQVAVYINLGGGRSAFCGGSLIHPKWVLTAAHCIEDGSSWTLILGSNYAREGADNKQVIRHSTRGIYHEDYNFFLNNDIGVIELDEPVELNEHVETIRLPSATEADDNLENIAVTVSGWGKTSDSSIAISERLNFVNLTTITNERCADVYGSFVVISSTLCAVGRPEHSTCNGDSGGPLVIYNTDNQPTQVGVVSFVHVTGCSSGNPSGYVRPGKFLKWISETTALPLNE